MRKRLGYISLQLGHVRMPKAPYYPLRTHVLRSRDSVPAMAPSPLDFGSSIFSRKFRAFLRWMQKHGIEHTNGLLFDLGSVSVAGIGVKAVCDLLEGDLIATIPKLACLTVKTTAASDLIEKENLAGLLGLSVALMYERSLEETSSWYGYLQLLPCEQSLPLIWSSKEVDFLLGTELYKVIKEDRQQLEDDWKECIVPLSKKYPEWFISKWFTLEHFLAAKTLVDSRAFTVDEYHGIGMVPLADLFNHKTAAEDVHFTCVTSDSDSDSEQTYVSQADKVGNCQNPVYHKERTAGPQQRENDDSSQSSTKWEGRNTVLQMILVKDVAKGSEIFNTYGALCNCALLHRYGFTEASNPYDIVNIDFSIVMDVCLASFTSRHIRRCTAIWRKAGCDSCVTQNCEYFEITADGKPQADLLMLLFVIHLSDRDLENLNLLHCASGEGIESVAMYLGWEDVVHKKPGPEDNQQSIKKRARNGLKKECDLESWLLTQPVCEFMLQILKERDRLYPSSSLDEDKLLLQGVGSVKCAKYFHSLVLRVSERSTLKNCQAFVQKRLQEIKIKNHHSGYTILLKSFGFTALSIFLEGDI